MAEDFRVGDIVRIVGQEYVMTVAAVDDEPTFNITDGSSRQKDGPAVLCYWFDDHGRLYREWFISHVLMKTRPE